MELVIDNLEAGYVELAHWVLAHGEIVAPHGQRTREILGANVVLLDPRRALPVGVGRKLNPAIASAEALQLIGGVSHPTLMERVSPNFNRFLNGGTFDGAYGPRLRGQLPLVCDRLLRDRDTRQAVITIWDPGYDLLRDDSRDYPCTLSLHFMIRADKLDLHVTMRSNDVYWGAAYDFFQFTQLQLAVANTLGVTPGVYYHHANSLHVYERDLDAITAMEPTGDAPVELHHGLMGKSIPDVQARARALLDGAQVGHTEQEWWHIRTLAKYL